MPRRLNLPDSASVADAGTGGRMHAPSAARNIPHIRDLLTQYAPATGRALELASGTGEHAVALACALPGLEWQPTDVDEARLRSIDAHAGDAGLANLRPAITLDATAPGWSGPHGGQDLIVLVNLLHLISTPEARTLLSEAAAALAPDGMLFVYGPFLRDGAATSDGDARFDASLRAQDPEIGFKDNWDVIDWLHNAWLELIAVVEMPANNLSILARKPA
ncbi:MAG: DUF938 domain-containing protein [Sediminimonas sp.]|uniref:DUF938 domain-containing protein n=1 Tax=Sediminimonas sp. TaxID=2823379 RepID=UPI0028704AE4|nr:DUF938 domain-containing protein [Sediminimonas sp.]MDR9483983.1 DUF938 domain-containing protein [Sediminimonas sp.]